MTVDRYIDTWSGRRVDPLQLSPADIDIEDIAHALSMLCRFNGHCARFYSVAEHSVLVSKLCAQGDAMWGLLHDAAEAYLCDLPHAVKARNRHYQVAEAQAVESIAQRFGLARPIPRSVKDADASMLAAESAALMPRSAHPAPASQLFEAGKGRIACHPPAAARAMFLERYEQLSRKTAPFPRSSKVKQAHTLLGVDVGFSAKRPTTGIAWSRTHGLDAGRALATWESRRGILPGDLQPALIAIDGPLLPSGSSETMVRACELVFQRGLFQTRCKPGMSHFGTGLALRRAAAEAQQQFATLLQPANNVFKGPFLSPQCAVVEAFPNAFLGVMLREEIFQTSQKIRRGKRSDFLYEAARDYGLFERAVASLRVPMPGFASRMVEECDHEKRAAWVCLMTAAFALGRNATIVGDPVGGWFWLPPWELWSPWAQGAVVQAIAALQSRGIAAELLREAGP